ncbi:MAG: CaiB/BaiF CoA-transferase family protein [Pseudomonadota bacterium]
MADAPLSGLRVLDLSRILAGPTCAQTLADLGAEVIKVERVGRGDDTRFWGPPFLKDKTGAETKESAYYLSANRGKRSIAVDLAQAEGQALIRDLAARSDVLIENFKVGDLARYGLDYEALSQHAQGLVYCSITGFGQTGPYRHRAGYDFLIQGMGGIMSLTGEADGPPLKAGVAVADVVCGLYATVAIQAAIHARARTGRGQWIDLSLYDTQLAWLINQGQAYLTTGDVPPRRGNMHPTIVPYGTFPASDQDFILAIGNDAQFARFCAVGGCEDLATPARFATNQARVRGRDELIPLLRQVTVTRSSADWITVLEAEGVPCGPVHDLEQVFGHPLTQAREMVVRLPHPLAGEVDLIASPIKMSDTPVTYQGAPPLLGADTKQILTQVLGLSPGQIASLEAKGVIDTPTT